MEKILDLSQSELQELLDHPEKVESMAQESDEIQNIQLEREMSLASNRSLAEENLNMRPHLESQREVLVGKYTQLKAVRETYKEHQSIIERIVGQVSPEALFSRLQTEGEKAEAESEVLADVFLEGSLPLDSFLERFLVLRSVAHKRRVLIEKFQEAMQHKTEAITPSAHIGSPDGAPNNLWNPQTETATAKHLHQGNTKCLNSSYVTASQPLSSPAGGPCVLPYPPCQFVSSNVSPAVSSGSGPAVLSQVPSYAGSPFAPEGRCVGFGSAFRPPVSHPTQSSFPAPNPGSAFGQYTASHSQSNTASSYNDGGYNHPTRSAFSNSQPPTGRLFCRPGYGVP
ncbi:vacuolar protein sorting-associated protein 37C isoform X2 [Corythoichthys intestinalis]|nr:vacuolar protein sorting-associated protein 37C isoform X2 [Corythoichthys intestinalis]XP_057699890.1 vacuolar protein sorting-associated protein 37C isoform X2 [Corythoichthys intestinalis]XP_061791554.1 vacuolar protein sorting-associated protein 37C-like [Nerophis lumbriciformis]